MKSVAFRFFMFAICVIGIVMLFSVGDETGVKVSALAKSGQCGENVYWKFDSSTGKLIISGKGKTYDYGIEEGDSPFYENRQIKSVALSKTLYTYDGKTKKPSVVIKDTKGNTLKKDTDYTVKYASGREDIGTYKVKVTFKGKYSGSKTLSFKIVPGKVKNIKQNTKKRGLYVSWDKVNGATGYQIYEYKNGDWKKLITVKNNNDVKYVYNNSVRETVKWKIRAYYIDENGKYYYGAFSSVSTFKGVK